LANSEPSRKNKSLPNPTAPRHLVVQTAFLGDVVLCTPLVRALKSLTPGAQVDVVVREGLGQLLRDLGLAHRVFEIKKGDGKSYRSVLGELSSVEYDTLVVPHQSLRSAFFARKVSAKKKVSFSSWWNGRIFHQTLPRPMDLPDVLRQLSLMTVVAPEWKERIESLVTDGSYDNPTSLGPIVLSQPIPSWAQLKVELPFDLKERVRGSFDLPAEFLVLAPGSVWATKRWSGYGELARKQKLPVVFLGSRDEYDLCQSMSQGVAQSINLAGRTSLIESVAILSLAKHLYCNDSGVLHLGALAGVPITAIFGPTVLGQGYRPWAHDAVVVQKPHPCRPCGRHGHAKCPIGTHVCMTLISVEDVETTARRYCTS
jgi:heptosyltransferase II